MSNSMMNAAAGMLLLVTGFCCSIVIARLLGPEANGTIAFALWVAATGALVSEIGTGILLMRLLPQLKARGLTEADRRGFAAYLALPVVMSTMAVTLLYGALSWEAEHLHWIETATDIVVLTGILLFIQSIGSFSKNYLIGEQRLGTLFRFTLVSSLLQLSLVVAGALTFDIEGALIGYIAGQIIQFGYTLRVVVTPRNSAGYDAKFLATTSVVLFFEFILSAVFLSRPELFFLQQFRSVEEVGYYAVALSLANLALQLPVQLTGSLLPFYAEQQEISDPMAQAGTFAAIIRSFAYITFPLCFGLAAISGPLVTTIYGEAFAPSGLLVAILAAGSPAYVFIQLTTQYLYSMDRVKARFLISILGATIMVVGCLVAVPYWGGTGAAIVRAVVFAVMAILLLAQMRFARNAGPLVASVAKIALSAAACGGVAFALTEAFPNGLGLIAAVLAGAVTYGVMLRLLRAVPSGDALVIDGLLARLPTAAGRAMRRFFALIAPVALPQVAGE